MSRALRVASLFVGGLLVAAYLCRDAISFAYLAHRVRPALGFDATAPPPSPDYTNARDWAALPDRDDAADSVPIGAEPDAQRSARADVFFIHPTTYYRNAGWNQPLDDAAVNRFTDEVVIRGAASVFNACCRVYAPRYRQAALGALPLFDETEDGTRALELAYGDVEAAFDEFLTRTGDQRPFVIAAHSQGSALGRWLLERRIAGTPAAERLVVAYLIGFGVRTADLAGFPLCDTASARGCVVVWNAVGPDAAPLEDTSDHACVNPLTWRTDGAPASHEANDGAVFFQAQVPLPFDSTPLEAALARLVEHMGDRETAATPARDEARVESAAADAQCVDGRLVVREIRSARFRPSPVWSDNYHAYDYSLFWMNLRRDAVRRLAAVE